MHKLIICGYAGLPNYDLDRKIAAAIGSKGYHGCGFGGGYRDHSGDVPVGAVAGVVAKLKALGVDVDASSDWED